jgi:FKBP-type peptidyl-prolyl cis-trans isomerase FkpA
MRARLRILAVAVASLSAGCTSSPAAPTVTPPFSQAEIVIGLGDPAAAGQSLNVNYTGWLYAADAPETKGVQFDSNRGGSPFTFTLGGGQVIQGWDQGLVGLRVGGSRRLVIPPSLAYGSTRHSLIPPNATLVFDVELVSIGQ